MLNPIGSQILETKRFILRPFLLRDANMMYHFYLNDPFVCEYLEFEPYKTVEDVYKIVQVYVSNYHNPFYFHWAIVDKNNGYVIGSTSIHNIRHLEKSGELGICISRLYWKKGVGKEVLNRLIDYSLKDIGIVNLYAFYIEGNISSQKLLFSIGMEPYPRLNNYIVKKNEIRPLICMKLRKAK